MDKRDNVRKPSLVAKKGGADPKSSSQGKRDASIAIQAEEKVGSIEDLVLHKTSQGGIELSKLVAELEGDLGYSRDRILRRLMEMKDSKKFRMVEKRPYSSLVSYCFSPMSLWFWGAALAAIASLLLVFVSSGFALYLRYVFGGLIILFLPGYSLVELLYAKKQELEDLTRIALSIGLSLAIVPLVGLVLNYTPFGIRLYPVSVSLVALTIIFLIGSIRRKHIYYKLLNDIL